MIMVGIVCIWADSLFIRWATHVLVNAINIGIHGQLFVAADVERSNSVDLPIGALQRLDYKPHIPRRACNFFSFTQTLNHICQTNLSPRAHPELVHPLSRVQSSPRSHRPPYARPLTALHPKLTVILALTHII